MTLEELLANMALVKSNDPVTIAEAFLVLAGRVAPHKGWHYYARHVRHAERVRDIIEGILMDVVTEGDEVEVILLKETLIVGSNVDDPFTVSPEAAAYIDKALVEATFMSVSQLGAAALPDVTCDRMIELDSRFKVAHERHGWKVLCL